MIYEMKFEKDQKVLDEKVSPFYIKLCTCNILSDFQNLLIIITLDIFITKRKKERMTG